MKLVIATPLYPPEPGGPATYAKALEESLPERGWSVEVVKFSSVRALPKVRKHLAYMRLVYRAAKRADVVLALDPVSVGLPAMLAARWAGKPFFLRVPGDYAWEQGTQHYGITQTLDDFVGLDGHAERVSSARVRMLQRVEQHVARAAKRVIVPSEYLKRVVCAWGVPARLVRVVYNAGPRKEAHHAKDEKPYLVTVARLVSWKGIADAIRALALLHSGALPEVGGETFAHTAHPDLRYVVVGDGPERGSLEALARDLGLADAVTFTGARSPDEARTHLHRAAAFILPTRYEGLSHTILEAFVEGVPVVTTPVGGNPELVEDGKTGLMTPVGNAEALAAAIARILEDHPLRDRIIEQAEKKAATFTRERMIDDTIAALSGK